MGENIFVDERDTAMYLDLLKKYKEQYGFKLFSFALMPASLTLLMELTEGEKLSLVMHDLSSSYTKYYNNRYARRGHLFRERFKSVVVEKDPYLVHLVRYIHTSPVRLGFAKTPTEYSFTSNAAYLYDTATSSTDDVAAIAPSLAIDLSNEVREVMDLAAKIFPEKKDYAELIASVTKEEMNAFAKNITGKTILGSRRFIETIDEELKKKEAEDQAQQKKERLSPLVTLTIFIVIAGVVAAVMYYQRPRKVIVMQEVEKRVLIKDSLKDIDGTEWVAELMPEKGAQTTYPRFDKITFKNGTVFSEYLISSGFVASNYSTTTLPDGTIVWETMQRNLNGEIVFLKGEEKDGNMNGAFRKQFVNGSLEGVSFVSPGYYKIKEAK
ncbi:MAG TPA: transposase [Candidatus Omnitrophota bacterium]|nr:transposase [Candidatus Omnitrophota bacterium]